MREVRWERMFPDELEAAFAGCPVVYFPYGLCEPHGPQCTVGLDALKAHAIAVRAAREHGGIVAPPDYWHVHEIGGYAVWASQKVGEVDRTWTTSMPPWQHFRNVLYHIRTADRLGFHAAIFLTGHYGPNWRDLKTLLELAQPQTKTLLYGLPDFEANLPGFDRDGRSGGDHAGKVETSLLAALEPDCVDLSRLPGGAAAGEAASDGAAATFLTRPPFFAMGEDAAGSSRREGERMVDDEVRYLGTKTRVLLDEYDSDVDRPGFPTYASVERFWLQTVRPLLYDFGSMEPDFGRGSVVPEGSRWMENSEIPGPEVLGP
ncbi:MAG: creatininase family protein [Spirochaetota bacterium]